MNQNNPNDPNKKQSRIKTPHQQSSTKLNLNQNINSTHTNGAAFSKGWRYYVGLTAGVFIGAIAANVILSFVFKRRSFDHDQNKPMFSISSGYIQNGEKHYTKKPDNTYDQLQKSLGQQSKKA